MPPRGWRKFDRPQPPPPEVQPVVTRQEQQSVADKPIAAGDVFRQFEGRDAWIVTFVDEYRELAYTTHNPIGVAGFQGVPYEVLHSFARPEPLSEWRGRLREDFVYAGNLKEQLQWA